MGTKKICCLGDKSSHGGTVISTETDNTVIAQGTPVCVEGAQHSCPIPFHGVTSITPITLKSYVNGKLIITEGAQAGCGAIIQPEDRKVYVE